MPRSTKAGLVRGTCLLVASEMAAARFDLQNMPSAAALCFGAAGLVLGQLILGFSTEG